MNCSILYLLKNDNTTCISSIITQISNVGSSHCLHWRCRAELHTYSGLALKTSDIMGHKWVTKKLQLRELKPVSNIYFVHRLSKFIFKHYNHLFVQVFPIEDHLNNFISVVYFFSKDLKKKNTKHITRNVFIRFRPSFS